MESSAPARTGDGRSSYIFPSNGKRAAGIHFYEKHGLVHDAGIMAAFGARYARCDVGMLWRERPVRAAS